MRYQSQILVVIRKPGLKGKPDSPSQEPVPEKIVGTDPVGSWFVGLKLLHDIETNPGPQGPRRKEQENMRKRLRRSRVKDEKRKIRVEAKKNEGKIESTRLATWNVQRMSLNFGNRRKLRYVLEYVLREKLDIVLLTEIAARSDGVQWHGHGDSKVVIIHSQKAAILLRGVWADHWILSGSRKFQSERVVSVVVRNYKLISVYQHLWDHGMDKIQEVRRYIEDQLVTATSKQFVVIGGDWNATIGKADKAVWAGTVGKYGLGRMNEAGDNLLQWAMFQNLCWANSFSNHPNRGTWFNPAYRQWHEIDGFFVKKSHRHQLIRNIRTLGEYSLSDHKPKLMTLRTVRRPVILERKVKAARIQWEKLHDENIELKFKENTKAALQKMEEEKPEIEWSDISSLLMKEAEKVCGKVSKRPTNPWMMGREEEAKQYQQMISRETSRLRSAEERAKERRGDEEAEELVKEARSRRQNVRKEYKKKLRNWEKEWWQEKLEECKEACDKGEIGRMYKLLKLIGCKEANPVTQEERFTPDEYRNHFSKVSANRHESTQEEQDEAIKLVEDLRNEEKAKQAAEHLERDLTEEEICDEWKKIREGAPGEDGIRIGYVRKADKETQRVIIRILTDMWAKHADEWEPITKKGLMVPLFKKGDRSDLNNYRGVCLLSMASRILARVMATRLREWSEAIGVLDDNQNGFRAGRSTADTAQIMIRIEEEASMMIQREEDETWNEGPCATLLDITKAYPRVNRSMLWRVLERYGMRPTSLRLLQNLHEKTAYAVRGREVCSEPWTPERGLREGCATSPCLFNIYHAAAMRIAKSKREEAATRRNWDPGIVWSWIPGHSMPPKNTTRADRSSAGQDFRITECLFADDTTVLGQKKEIQQGVTITKAGMKEFEEKCHDGKEEYVEFGIEKYRDTRILGSWLGRKVDTERRVQRGRRTWFSIKKRLCNSRLSRRTQARIVQATVEATMLFNCAIRPWTNCEIKRMQQVVDAGYRYIWRRRNRGPTLKQMEREGTNSFGIRKQLETTSLRAKVEIRSLERLGHVLRMPNSRTTKKITLGWLKTTRRKVKRNQSTVVYWRKLLKEANIDYDDVEVLSSDREEWKQRIVERKEYLERWEAEQCLRHKNQDLREIKIERSEYQPQDERLKMCPWPQCGRRFATIAGRKVHQRVHKKEREESKRCDRCQQSFGSAAVLQNHRKACKGAPRGTCVYCGEEKSASNMSRHQRSCALANATREPYRNSERQQREEDLQRMQADNEGNKVRCQKCGEMKSKSNIRRHERTCKGEGRQTGHGGMA